MRSVLCSLVALHLALTSLGCAGMHGPSKGAEKKKVVDEPDETEDAGITAINAELRQFNTTLNQKSFEEAAGHLRKAQLMLQRATELTRSHPEFEDTTEAVEMASTRYGNALEADRIAKRNAAIDQLVKRGNSALQQSAELEHKFQDKVPNVQDIGAMRTVLQELADIRINGQQYMDDENFAKHSKDRDEKARALATREALAQWQIDASQALAGSVETARQEIVVGQKATNPEEQASHFRIAAQAFSTCLATISSLESRDHDIDSRVVLTALGTMSIANTRKECTERSTRLRHEVDKLAWHGRMTQALAGLAEAEPKRRAAKTAAEVASAVDVNITALQACSAELEGGAKMPGYDPKAQFESPYGKLTTPQIARNCAHEREQLTRDRPMYIWRGAADTLRDPYNIAKQKADQAGASSKTAEKIELWSTVKVSAGGCADQAAKLEGAREADKKYPITTSAGPLTVVRLHEECANIGKNAEAELKRARSAAELEQFMTQLKADEIEVAKRNGVPTRIETVEGGGRVFVYEKAQYGFDAQGKSFDFRAHWKQKVDSVVADIARFILPVRNGATAEAVLTATEAAINGMSQCEGALPAIDRRPGFDANAEFDTAIGKLYAVQIAKACGTEREKLQRTVTALRWRAQFEKVRDRAAQAESEIAAAKQAPSAAKRVTLLSTAMGGLKECNERAEALANGVGADAKLELTSPFGKVTRKKLASECVAALGKAQKDLDVAINDKKLEDFIAASKGDEKEVAKREGMPLRVESKGGGRVFVYAATGKPAKGKKAEDRRIAFNAQGQRVAEETLK